jgi:hypothetical protein
MRCAHQCVRVLPAVDLLPKSALEHWPTWLRAIKGKTTVRRGGKLSGFVVLGYEPDPAQWGCASIMWVYCIDQRARADHFRQPSDMLKRDVTRCGVPVRLRRQDGDITMTRDEAISGLARVLYETLEHLDPTPIEATEWDQLDEDARELHRLCIKAILAHESLVKAATIGDS